MAAKEIALIECDHVDCDDAEFGDDDDLAKLIRRLTTSATPGYEWSIGDDGDFCPQHNDD